MKKNLHIALVAASLIPFTAIAEESVNTEAMVAESRATAMQFGKTLKGELMAAVKAGGPVNGINICNERAPEIAKNISEEKGWDVSRTSLKLRNANNAPDSWETSVLNEFDKRRAAGEDPKKMEYFEIVQSNGNKELRYMKAIGVAPQCLTCHGTSIPDPIKAKLDTLYPNDEARGYTAGQIRGAFTITQTLD